MHDPRYAGTIPAANEERIRLQEVSFGYPGQAEDMSALSAISSTVGPGLLVALLGRSGAGKSTLGRCLNGLIPHAIRGRLSGRVRVCGQDTSEHTVAQLAGHVGLVLQDFENQLFRPTVELEVAFGPENLGVGRQEIRRRVSAALEAVGLSGFEQRDPMALSGGQKQRVAVAGVLALEPDVLCLDEAMSDLDPIGQREVLAVARRLAGEGRTVILADHDPERVLCGDRALVLKDGRLMADCPAAGLLGARSALPEAGLPEPAASQAWVRAGMDGAPPLGEGFRVIAEQLRPHCRPPETRPAKPAATGDTVIEVRDVYFDYGDQPALNGLSFDVREGEIVAVIGGNGGGKSTLLKHVCGLLHPLRGDVLIAGRSTRGLTASQLCQDVGYVAQNPDHQLFSATVYDDVAFAPRHLGLAEDDVRAAVADALEAVGMAGREREDPITMPKGDRQRVALAGALAQRPRVLLLDEPTTGLDHEEVVGTMELVRMMNERGTTVIMVTHSLWVVPEYAHRAIVLREGRVHAEGTPRDVLGSRDRLAECGLEPPPAAALGIELGIGAVTVEELLAALEVGGSP